MKRFNKHLLALSISASLPLISTGSAADSGAARLEEVLVTAQKREQRLVDVPMSISAFSGEELQQKGITNIQDLSFSVPGMSLREYGPGSYIIFMRGLANTDSNGALVSVYLDEAPLTLTGADQLDLRPIDLERVEILKGPQGTLYGQGAIAGTVKYVTRNPDFDGFYGDIKGSFASIDDGDTREAVTATLNMPVIDDVFALRFAGTVERGGGWQDQPEAGIEDGNYQDLNHFRLRALWNVSDRFTANLLVQSHRNKSKLGLGFEEPDRTVAVAIDPAIELVPKEYDYDLYSLTLDYDLGFANLISATTYVDHDHQYPFTYFGTDQTIYDGTLEGNDERQVNAEQITQELRLVSAGDTRFNWTIGAIYQDLQRDFFAVYDTLSLGVLYPGADYVSNYAIESYALFGDVSYDLTQRLEIGLGVRYYDDDQTSFDGGLAEADGFNSTDPRLYASYALNDNTNLYASAARGFRTGGFNRGELPNYDPESVTSYEIGTKASLLGGMLDVEAAAYYTEYDDMLRRGLFFQDNSLIELTSNIGNVEVTGFEAGANWSATEQLTLTATASWIDSEVVDVRADDATNQKGDPTDYVPEFSYTLGAHYTFNWFGNQPGYARLDYNYRDAVNYVDRTSFPSENLPQMSDDLSLLNARIGISWERVSLELFGTNLTNENDYIDPYWGWKNANRTRPRTLGVEATYTF
ncbi:TonB-dependent receptor [Parahaliea mediterranea]|uniref:TonB-dependent receptor n=1 Tax=Parahaliea mediterranea TaxID=651086 RepID=UPI000E2EBF3E|nr:TonB-dependent receptor [Parahaliea mediterranea]